MKINSLGYIPVGLGENIISLNLKLIKMVKIFQIKIHIMVNILFIIGYGKIIIKINKEKWIGFCQYRKYWSKK